MTEAEQGIYEVRFTAYATDQTAEYDVGHKAQKFADDMATQGYEDVHVWRTAPNPKEVYRP